ncbi:hypothetical protein PEX1_041120 [Penicillium expansum]|uniref:Nucleoside phosphorylase domain-containing protein n=1 Tax=Penicillium expansum TaxID=27334 RepID=A0A0A2JEX5_PENEN|nr:hypothetical protein PEX2_034600 [Penicillium expansum]KGO53939.1 hypothetical protein PEX1_041120 [Penicillium expansum]KGO60282.1 hypothetical protein PEX2_034600 [Penicillium expansum]
MASRSFENNSGLQIGINHGSINAVFSPPREAFHIGWICALPIEAAAAQEMLDERFGRLDDQDMTDLNTYILGRIGKHNVVIACLPGGTYGTTSAATVAINMVQTFSNSLRIGLIIGTGGGLPSAAHDIRLGDIVISYPQGICGGVLQYDMGRAGVGSHFHQTASLNTPPTVLLKAVDMMRASELTDDLRYPEYMESAIKRTSRTHKTFARPSAYHDRLFKANYNHPATMSNCDECLTDWEEIRNKRESNVPEPHYGIIASGNTIIKDGRIREQLRLESDALCFETEAAGLMTDFPCIFIRGISDYADSHKNRQWQGYAALAAASYAKELLGYIPEGHFLQENLAGDVFTRLLLNDDQLMSLYKTAISKVGFERFQRNFSRMLKRYGSGLSREACNEIQREAAHFVRLSARQTAVEVRIDLMENNPGLSLEKNSKAAPSELTRVNEWIESHTGGRTDRDADGDESSVGSDLSDTESTTIASLERVKEFLVSTQAFSDLKLEFQRWLESKRRAGHGVQSEEKITHYPGSYNDIQMVNSDSLSCVDVMRSFGLDASIQGRLQYAADHGIREEPFSPDWNDKIRRDVLRRNDAALQWHSPPWWFRFLAIYSPPAAGYQRIPYLCGCGKFTYLDVRELSAGGIDRFRQKLLASSRAVQAQEQTGSIHNHLETPAQVHLSNIGETFSRRSTRYIPIDPYLSQSTQRGNSLVTSASDPDSKFLLLCINTKDSTVLSHVEVASLTNDQHLFEQILIEYKKARENSEFRVTSIIPQLLSNFANTISTRIPRLPYLSKFFSLSVILRHVHQMRLYRIESGDFVQFQLVPIGMRCLPMWFQTKRMPPKVEVEEGRYLYDPVPLDDVEMAYIPLNHLLKPGPHSDNFWITRFPKKIRDPLSRLPGSGGMKVTGWGIHVNECLNWTVVLLSMFITLLIIGLSVTIYALTTSDSSSAFGLGSFLVALFTVYFTYQYFAWKENV